MPSQSLHDSHGSFEVKLLPAPKPRGTVLFAPGAGHFSVMHVVPPQREDPHPNRDEFLSRLTASILAFASA